MNGDLTVKIPLSLLCATLALLEEWDVSGLDEATVEHYGIVLSAFQEKTRILDEHASRVRMYCAPDIADRNAAQRACRRYTSF